MPRKSKARPDPPASGILSGVFSFVSREFDSFVASATGSSTPGPSTSGVLSDEDSENYDSEELDDDQCTQYEDNSPPRKRSRTSHPPRRTAPPPSPARRHKGPKKHNEPRVQEYTEEGAQVSDGSRRSPSPMPLSRILKRRPSFTMPGSLFPRSPSLEPDSRAFAADREHRVRFSSREPSSVSQPSDPSGSNPLPALNATISATPRRRSHLASSVKSAVDKFHIGDEDADPSILLPSPKKSPLAMGKTKQPRREDSDASTSVSSINKGKSRAVDPDSSGLLRVQGKEKELVAAREELDRHRRRLDRNDDHEQSFLLEQAERSRDKDRERIRMLEEEIERLKAELSRRPTATFIDTRSFPPPPPPPPPPPLPKKNIINVPTTGSDPNLFASARASLKQAPTPVENPIVPVRRAGIATVGIAPDKMAAFLNEMKTVRLRKTSERAGDPTLRANATFTAPTPPSRVAQLPLRRSMSLQRPPMAASTVSGPTSNVPLESDARIGEKRKRMATGEQEETQGSSKRQSGASSAHSSFENVSTSSASQTLLAESSMSSSSRSHPAPARVVIPAPTNKARQTSSVPDAPTPSLCSDKEEDASPEDRPPSTPPLGPSRSFYRFRGNGIPIESDTNSEKGKRRSADVTMGDVSRQERQRTTFIREKEPRPNVFDKRIPSSPFPDKSPRRPRIPSRPSRTVPRSPPPPPRDADHSDDEDPLSLSFSSPETAAASHVNTAPETARQARAGSRAPSHSLPPPPPESTRSPTPLSSRSSRSRRGSGRPQASNRRLTLDEELRSAVPFLHEDDEKEELNDELESGVLTGVGTKSKGRGFLAHGGAGGAPVFMGVGYVEGAEEDLLDDTVESESSGRRARGRAANDDDEYLPSPPTRKNRTNWRR